jgi:threonine/homoserine/homoserine lactone efflux protein
MSGVFGAYLGISFLVIATPGPDSALVIRNALLGGRRGGIFTSVGVVLGQATWTLASSAGLAAPLAPGVALRQGLISNLGNPKVAVFFTSLLPQFTPEGRTSFLALLGLGLVFCAMTLIWLTGYALAVTRAGDFMRRLGVRRALDGILGAVLVALGLRLASEHR